jgi:hypothetical protein
VRQKGFSLIIIVVLVVGGIAVFYYLLATKTGMLPTIDFKKLLGQSQPGSSLKRKYNFKFKELKVGDTFGVFEVASIKPYNNQLPLGQGNFVVSFSGKAKISGKYERKSVGSSRDKFAFNPSQEAVNNLFPRLETDSGDGFSLIFTNQDLAQDLIWLRGLTGEGTIEIDGLSITYYPTEVDWTTTLVKVVED